MAPVCTVDGRQAAQVMIICGCDNGGSVRLPGWRQNLRFAAAWERSMEGMYPGFTRPVLFSYRFYNQDLTTGSLLIEIGGHGNNPVSYTHLCTAKRSQCVPFSDYLRYKVKRQLFSLKVQGEQAVL